MPKEATINAIIPEVKSSIKIDIAEFTITFIIKTEHNNRLLSRRIGKIFFAYLRSCSDPRQNNNLF